MTPYEIGTDDTPISGQLFADIIISLMSKSPQGPSEEEGRLLIFIKNQGTSPDEEGKLGRTPRVYASQHRLPVWLRFIIHRLEVDPPGDTSTERHRGSFDVDRRHMAELPLGSSERDILRDVLKSNSDPQSARFNRKHYREKMDSTDKAEALRKGYDKLDSSPFAEDMPEEDPVKMGLWMVGKISAELAVQAFSGTLLFDVYQVGMGIADIWMRWRGRKEAKGAWRAFAIAYRQVLTCAWTLDKLTEDPYAPSLATDAKKSLKDWTEAIKGAVMRVREEIERAIEGHRVQQSHLLNLMYRSTAELMVKHSEINKEISQLQQVWKHAEEIIAIKTTVTKLQAIVERRQKLDAEVEGSLKILLADIGSNNGSTATSDQKEEAFKQLFNKLVIIRDEEETGDAQLVDNTHEPYVNAAGSSRASTAGGVEEAKGRG
ncbi:unnamed protein product [Ascophyllum nodosum]